MRHTLQQFAGRVFRPWREAERLRAELAAVKSAAGQLLTERNLAKSEVSALCRRLNDGVRNREGLEAEVSALRARAEKAEAERDLLVRMQAEIRDQVRELHGIACPTPKL